MKKVLSLFIACSMILSLSAVIVANAANEGYTITYGSLSTSYDEDFEEYSAAFVKNAISKASNVYDNTSDKTKLYSNAELVSLVVSNNNLSGGGYIVIDYDENVVTPVSSATKVSASKGAINVYLKNSDANTDWVQSAKASVTTLSSAQLINKESTGEVLVGWYGANGKVAANSDLFYIHFVCKEGKSSADFTKDTFKLSANDSEILAENKLTDGATKIAAVEDGKFYTANDDTITVSFTYPNSDKGGDVDWRETVDVKKPSDTTDKESDFVFPSKTDGGKDGDTSTIARKAVMFAKATEDLTKETYGIWVGDFFYPGLDNVSKGQYWSIVLLTTGDDTALTKAEGYTYKALIKTNKAGESLTGTETATEKAFTVTSVGE